MKNRAGKILGVILAALLFFCVPSHAAQPLVADLSEGMVAINTDFKGRHVVLFGSAEEKGDVIVEIKGPKQNFVVRQKERLAGAWISHKSVRLQDTPSFYDVAMSGEHAYGLTPTAPKHVIHFWEGFVRNQQEDGLYLVKPKEIKFLDEHLFRATFFFPSNAPVGTYDVNVRLVRGGKEVSEQNMSLLIGKVGFNAQLSKFARYEGVTYGLLAILLAVFAGWLADAVFRRP